MQRAEFKLGISFLQDWCPGRHGHRGFTFLLAIFDKLIQLLLHSKVTEVELYVLDGWLSQWMTRANLSYINLSSKCKCLTGNDNEHINYPLIGNGFCNDETNKASCNYDGGDCCGICVNTQLCSDCVCFDNVNSTVVHNAFIGNGFCNDETNTFECNYDGGDCCGSCVIPDSCSNCSCLHDVTTNGASNPLLGTI